MTTRSREALLILVLGSTSLLACGSPIVGAECAPGTSRCGESCIDLQRDPDHCGECDQSCGRFECRDAHCGPGLRPDGAHGDGGTLVDGPPFLPDGGFAFPDVNVGRGCGLGQSRCGDDCVDLQSDSRQCGQCGVSCPANEYCQGGTCKMCDPPLQLCNGCVDVQIDPFNCGGCDRVCRSGICEAAVCADLLTGHLVVIGHDYTGSSISQTAKRLIGNAVFLAQGSPVSTVVYEGTASEASIAGVTAALDFVVDKDGREFAARSVATIDLGAELRDADALLVHAQVGSSDAELLALGQRWGLALSQFLLRGGVIVLIEAPSQSNLGTFQLLRPAGLFESAARAAISSQTLEVATPGVGVAARTTRTYRSPTASVHFLGVTSPATPVVRDRDGEPVVLHRTVVP